jgi:DMSO reductase iron-sulfur subunit
MQKSFVFEVDKCTGCEACQVACTIENEVDPRISWRRVYTFNPRRFPGIPAFNMSLACNHCVDPPCMRHCPALAYSKEPDSGAVTIDAGKCIGCRYCSWTCPFDAPQFNHSTGTVEKCNFCLHRLRSGMDPACVALCPTRALRFGDFEDDGTGRIQGLTPTTIGPAIRVLERKGPAEGPVCSAAAVRRTDPVDICGGTAARIGLRSEWTLLVFTFLASLLVGAFASTLINNPTSHAVFAGRPLLFVLVAVAAMALSARHLGRKRKAWRAVLNWRRSWLSREVLLFFLFLAGATAVLLSGASGGGVAWAVAAVGFVVLVAMDRVYDVWKTPGYSFHSAQALPTGVLFTGVFAANETLFGLVAVAKTVLYLGRKYDFFRRQRGHRPWLTRARVLVGLAMPLLIWWKAPPSWFPAVVVGVVVGELIDRCEFYLEIEAPSPAGQMEADLAAHVAERQGFRRTNL